MVSVEDLAKVLNCPRLIEESAEEARGIALVAEARARCEINRYNNESRSFRYSGSTAYCFAETR